VSSSRARPLRSHLTGLVLVSVVPLLIFAVIVATVLETRQRAALESSFVDTARALAVAMDRELTSSISLLQALATSEHLDAGELRLFYAEAKRVAATHPEWLTINLSDPSGRQLLNLTRPLGEVLPSIGHLEDVRRTLATGEVAVSNLFAGLVLKVPTVGFTVPVRRNGTLRYVLGARLDVRGLSGLLSQGRLPPTWTAEIIDRNGVIIARTRDAEAFLGRRAGPEVVAGSRESGEGSLGPVPMDGAPAYAVFSRSRLSGWTVGLTVPVAVVEASGRASRWAIIGGGALFLLLATALATVFSRRIAGAIGSLSASAHALEHGEIPPSPTKGAEIAEIADVEHQLANAARQRAAAAANLLSREASFRLLFADNPIPMWVYDVETKDILEVNGAAVAQYGYSRAEFLRMSIGDLRPVTTPPGTTKHRWKDGRERDVSVVSHALEFGGRQGTLIAAIDVTQVAETQRELQQYAERLAILHEIDRAIIAQRPLGEIAETVLRRLRPLLGVPRAIVNLFDLETGEVEWLAAAGRHRIRVGPGVRYSLRLMGDLDGLKRGERQLIDTDALPPSPERQALLTSDVHVYMVVPMIAGGELIGGLSFGGPTGQFPAEQIGIAEEAAAQLAIAIAQTRLRERIARHASELEARVRERTGELATANGELEAFSYSVAHDLRAPLRAMDGFSRILLQRWSAGLDPEARRLIDRIGANATQMSAMVADLLAFSSLGRQALTVKAVALDGLVQEVLAGLEPERAGRCVELVVGPLPSCQGDPALLRQVFVNLLGNALKFTRKRAVARIEVGAQESGGPTVYFVRDNGVGFDMQYAAKVFGVFQRHHRAEEYEGTGVGLSIVQRIVRRHGGRIWVEAAVDAGAAFFFTLGE
jgi:signal transduction histidine kinase/PAS domain-containing protein